MQWTDVRVWYRDRMVSETLWRFFFSFCFIACTRASLRSESPSLSPFTMTTPTQCSPSRSSLSCCQFDRNSQDDMRGPAIIRNNNYFLQREKHFFPKRPEVDLSFQDIRYHVKEWSIRNFSISKYEKNAKKKKKRNQSINDNNATSNCDSSWR